VVQKVEQTSIAVVLGMHWYPDGVGGDMWL